MNMLEFYRLTSFDGVSSAELRKKRDFWVKRWRAGGANGNGLMWIGRIIDTIDAILDPQCPAAQLDWHSMGLGPY